MAMRVYEFSRDCNISSKKLLDELQSAGFAVESHMAVLTPEQISFLNDKFDLSDAKKTKNSVAPKSKSSKKSAAPANQEEDEDEQVLDKSIVKKSKKQNQKQFSSKFTKKEAVQEEPETPKVLLIKAASVDDVARQMGVSVTEVIIALLRWGIVATKNQLLTEEVIERLGSHYQIEMQQVDDKKDEHVLLLDTEAQDLQKRPPVVVIMGHVDHGKTTLLDYIRKTRVAAKEKGGITQHLGAYAAHTSQGEILFIDTPGHEAFSKMRARGAKVADIAVIVIAADDSVKPQTVEAIKHAKNMNVPIVVAVNKIDKVPADRVEIIKRDIAKYDLLPEDWGGDTVVVPVSAKEGTGVDELLEIIILQADLKELQADFTHPAKGYVLESKLERGRGPVATLLCRHGKIELGDYFVCGSTTGKVTSLMDSFGKSIKKADVRTPVQVAGFDDLPEAGAFFEVVPKDVYIKMRSLKEDRKVSAQIGSALVEGTSSFIVKADTDSSKEALIESMGKLGKKINHSFNIVYAGIGEVTESDVMLASNTGASIIAFHVKPNMQARSLIRKYAVRVYQYDIIYKLLEELEDVTTKAFKKIEMIRVKIGEAEVRRVFDIKNIGVIAGCYVKDGLFSKDGIAVGFRGTQKIGEGKIKSLQRERKTVKEVHAGYECGFIVESVSDWQEGDRIECYIEKPAESK